MRPRKKKWTKDVIEASPYVIQDNFPVGQWKQKFKKKELHVEIGAGKGDYWQGMAQLYPEALWIALEKNETVAGIATRKIEQQSDLIDYAKLLRIDATDLLEVFAPSEVDVIHLNFSDPWPKKRHEKRRLTSPDFQEIYCKILCDNGLVIQKTDNVSLFNYSLVAMLENFDLIEVDVDYRSNDHQEDAFTEYERKFHELGQPIFRAIYRKRSVSLL